MGWCWWDWPARLYPEEAAAADRSFCVYGKEAEKVLRQWYAKPAPEPQTETVKGQAGSNSEPDPSK